MPDLVLQMTCADRPGILAQATPYLARHGCDIREAAVYGDPDTNTFFVRMHVRSDTLDAPSLREVFKPVGDELAMTWRLHDMTRRMRVLIAVSKFDHCLNHLLYERRAGHLPIEVVAVMSNHDALREPVEREGVPYHHLPVSPDDKPAQEAAFLKLADETGAELVVLARYMQILSDDLCGRLEGRCINIHHSFLPSFKGAKPYHQAHERGVKIIGATAHYVTRDLDEGPIIEQDVRRVFHATTPQEMIAIGREVEASVLARAVRWHAERRVFVNGQRTVVLI